MRAVGVEAFGQTACGESIDFLGSADGVAHADACEAVDFGEGSRNDYTVVVDRIVDERGVIRCCSNEVMVSLVNENRSGGGKLANEFFEALARGQAASRIVWVAYVEQTRGGASFCEHGRQIVGVIFGERYFDDFRAQGFGTTSDGFEGR